MHRSFALLVPLVLLGAAWHRRPLLQLPASNEAVSASTLALEFVPVGDALRWYRVFVPPGSAAGAELPVLICFHGGGGNASHAIESYGIVEEAQKRGWMAVFPEGSGQLGGPPLFLLETWNAGGCCVFAQQQNIDDVGFFEALLQDLEAKYPVNRRRVFLTGMSNGAMMSYRIAAERTDLIAGFAPVAGALEAGQPTGAVPLLAIHGLLDQNVPFAGGLGSGVAGVEFTSQLDSLLPFYSLNGAEPIYGPYSQGAAQIFVAPGGPQGADTWYFLATDGGHSWPGAPGKPFGSAQPVHQDVPATPLMFDFFELQRGR